MSVDGGAALRNECAEEIDGVHVYRRIVMVQCDEGGDKASRCEYCAKGVWTRPSRTVVFRVIAMPRVVASCTCQAFSLSIALAVSTPGPFNARPSNSIAPTRARARLRLRTVVTSFRVDHIFLATELARTILHPHTLPKSGPGDNAKPGGSRASRASRMVIAWTGEVVRGAMSPERWSGSCRQMGKSGGFRGR